VLPGGTCAQRRSRSGTSAMARAIVSSSTRSSSSVPAGSWWRGGAVADPRGVSGPSPHRSATQFVSSSRVGAPRSATAAGTPAAMPERIRPCMSRRGSRAAAARPASACDPALSSAHCPSLMPNADSTARRGRSCTTWTAVLRAMPPAVRYARSPIARPRRLDEGYLHRGPGASSLVSGQTGIRPPGSRLLDRARQRVCAVPPPVFTHSPLQSVRYVFLAGAARTAVVRYRMEILAATT
jgi:hypothetical protein